MNSEMSDTVTMKAIKPPMAKSPRKAAVKAPRSTFNRAMPASVARNSIGVASISEVKNGANKPNNMAPIQAIKAAVYWPSRAVPLPDKMAFKGPVRQVDTVPTVAVIKEPIPHTKVIVLMGGRWPAAVSTVTPWLFCAARTVIIKGMTNSNIACHENAGNKKMGVTDV